MTSKAQEQIVGIYVDWSHKPPLEIPVGLYKVIGKSRSVLVGAESDIVARKIAARAGLKGTSAEPVMGDADES